MISTYLKIAIRNFLKEKFFSLLNVAGLAIGIAVALLISIYILHEFRYDRFHDHASRVYRIATHVNMGGNAADLNSTFPPMAAALQHDLPEVETAVRLYSLNGRIFKQENKVFSEDDVLYADPLFFSMFSFKMLAGDSKTALNDPYKILLTPALAKKYFDTDDYASIVGKSISVNQELHEITGIVADAPDYSHVKYSAVASMESCRVGRDKTWNSMNVSTYILLQPNASIDAVAEKLTSVIGKYMPNFDKLPAAGVVIQPFVQKLTDIHLHSNLQGEFETTSSMANIYIFAAIALIVLVLACVNFVNLTTARSTNRAKEVGVRKVLGSATHQLVKQFTFESILTVFLATLLALGIAELLRYPFNELSGKELSLDLLFNAQSVAVLIALIILVGMLAGIYPSFFLASYKPAQVLKGKLRSGFRSGGFRNVLVTFQFVISIVLITCTLVVQKQLEFMRSKKLGFDKENVLVIDNANRLSNPQSFFEALKSLPGVEVAGASSFEPVGDHDGMTISSEDDKENRKLVNFSRIDYDFLKTIKCDFVLGRNFSRDFSTDSSAVIINETAARFLFNGDPLNKKIENDKPYTVIGVIKDFNFESLKNEVKPLVYFLNEQERFLNVRLAPGNYATTIKSIENLWRQKEADVPFSYSFLDDTYNKLFQEESRLSSIFSVFTALGLFIACLGLLGLAAYLAEQRSKEISVRKVLGATASQIVVLLSAGFVKIIVIAFLIASPIGYFLMKQWLSSFAYKTDLSLGLLTVGGLLVMLIALLAVSYQSIRAAFVNPVQSLKEE